MIFTYSWLLDTWGQISKDSASPAPNLHIVGASRFEQLRQRLHRLKRRSLDEVVERINGIWKSVEYEVPLGNMEAFLNASV